MDAKRLFATLQPFTVLSLTVMQHRPSLFQSAALSTLLCAVMLTGCATSDSGIEGETLDQQKIQNNLAPLLEAKDREEWSCTAKDPLSTKRPLNDIVFVCENNGVEATLSEMKDAGWRLIALDIGRDETQADGTIAMPLRITVIKLF